MGQDLLNSILSLDSYRELANRPWPRSLAHLGLAVAILLLLAAPVEFLRFYGWAHLAEKAVGSGWPTLTFEKGRLSAEGAEPVILSTPGRELVLNPDGRAIPAFRGRTILFSGRGVYYLPAGRKAVFFPYPDLRLRLSPAGLTALLHLWPTAFVLAGIVIWLLLLLLTSLFATTLAIFGSLLSLAWRKRVSFGATWNLAAYAQTLPLLLFFLNRRLPELPPLRRMGAAPLPYFPVIYGALSLLYLVAGLGRLPQAFSAEAENAI